ncbi:MAG TPA: ABC transporter permease [Myxococcota bacterium]|jgi:ABC-type transport system involved in multi-copper enzyme maturation permease subunit|nr:ABC transporter permease [Myxococcota bacterium]
MNALRCVLTVAGNTMREAIRSRVLYTLLFFAILLIGTGSLLSTLSYVERERILQDVGLAAIRIFGVAIAIFVGIGLIHREVDRRTIYTILSKPISRTQFLVGKYLGLVATLWLQLAIMAAAFAGVSLLAEAPFGAGHLAALSLAGVEFAVVVAVATLFSSFTTPMLASLFATGLWAIGHLSRDLRQLGLQSNDVVFRHVAQVLHRCVPDLSAFDLTSQAVHGLPIAASDLWIPWIYGMGWVVVLLGIASFVFERRDFR